MPNKATHQIDKFDGVGIGLGFSVLTTTEDLNENGTTFVLDLAASLTQALQDEAHTYLYGNDRIAQQSASSTTYFLGDALGSVRQLVDERGALTLNQSYEPYGQVLNSTGSGSSDYGFTGEWTSSYIKLINLRSRLYSPEMGRFLTRDSWQGNYTRPLSLNKWNYVSGNPINRVDPLGLWELVPGFNLSAGGIYGKGVLQMQGSPMPCTGTCIGPASTDISIFVPPVVNGMLYNDQHYGRYGYTDIRMIKRLIEYDVIERNNLKFCYLDEFIIPKLIAA